ncbi:MAG: alkaline phosphatase [Spirochaetales bacterium]
MKKKILTLLLIFILVSSFTGCRTVAEIDSNISLEPNSIENTILIIGDGMGENHITAARTYLGQDLALDSINERGLVNTLSYSGTTDSAAAATAMATGQKVYNGQIARYEGNNLSTFLDEAKTSGKKTGVITSDYLYGATPAAFSAHADNRNDTLAIINSQITSNIDLLMGQGVNEYNNYSQTITNAGYDYVNDITNLNESASKVFGVFNSIDPQELATENSINITALANFALNYLTNPNGFVLVFEVADIDKRSHDHNLQSMIYELLMLDQLVSTVLNWMGENTNTFLMVTADHETGGLNLPQTDTYENLLNTYSFTTFGHTDRKVPYYAVNYDLKEDLIDNIDIYKLIDFLVQD